MVHVPSCDCCICKSDSFVSLMLVYWSDTLGYHWLDTLQHHVYSYIAAQHLHQSIRRIICTCVDVKCTVLMTYSMMYCAVCIMCTFYSTVFITYYVQCGMYYACFIQYCTYDIQYDGQCGMYGTHIVQYCTTQSMLNSMFKQLLRCRVEVHGSGQCSAQTHAHTHTHTHTHTHHTTTIQCAIVHTYIAAVIHCLMVTISISLLAGCQRAELVGVCPEEGLPVQ